MKQLHSHLQAGALANSVIGHSLNYMFGEFEPRPDLEYDIQSLLDGLFT